MLVIHHVHSHLYTWESTLDPCTILQCNESRWFSGFSYQLTSSHVCICVHMFKSSGIHLPPGPSGYSSAVSGFICTGEDISAVCNLTTTSGALCLSAGQVYSHWDEWEEGEGIIKEERMEEM